MYPNVMRLKTFLDTGYTFVRCVVDIIKDNFSFYLTNIFSLLLLIDFKLGISDFNLIFRFLTCNTYINLLTKNGFIDFKLRISDLKCLTCNTFIDLLTKNGFMQ